MNKIFSLLLGIAAIACTGTTYAGSKTFEPCEYDKCYYSIFTTAEGMVNFELSRGETHTMNGLEAGDRYCMGSQPNDPNRCLAHFIYGISK